MKELIIAKLNEIKEKSGGFSRFGTMRWANLFVTIDSKLKHVSEIEWCELDDKALLELFERIVKRYYTQM